MPDADPADVAIAMAHNALVRASGEPALNAMASQLLARALEFAVQGVSLAWGYPVAASKVQRHFESVIAAHVPSAVADFIRSVWEHPGIRPTWTYAPCSAHATLLSTTRSPLPKRLVRQDCLLDPICPASDGRRSALRIRICS